MKISDHDFKVLQRIVERCERITEVVARADSLEEYLEDKDIQELVAFNIFQIGELAKEDLSDEAKSTLSGIPWRDIIAMRHKVVHHYGTVAQSIVFATAKEDIPEIRQEILNVLSCYIPLENKEKLKNMNLFL